MDLHGERPIAVMDGTPVTATLLIDVPAETVYGFLAHLPNHAAFTDGRLRLVSLAADRPGGRIAIRGPLGIRRTAETTVTELLPDRLLGGTATVGRRTAARVRWTIAPHLGRSRVALSATIIQAGPLDRVLLALGGRRWLRRGFDRAIAGLAAALATPALATPALATPALATPPSSAP